MQFTKLSTSTREYTENGNNGTFNKKAEQCPAFLSFHLSGTSEPMETYRNTGVTGGSNPVSSLQRALISSIVPP